MFCTLVRADLDLFSEVSTKLALDKSIQLIFISSVYFKIELLSCEQKIVLLVYLALDVLYFDDICILFYINIVFLKISYSVDNIFFTPLRNTPSPDEQCLRAQSLLHPVCAQQPEQGGAYDVGGPSKQVACHDIAHACSGNPECNNRLERYNQVRFFLF